MIDTTREISVTYRRLILYALGLLLVGAVVAQLPSLVQDLRFLHAARVFNEQKTAEMQAQAATQRPVPNQEIQQSQVHPGVVPPAPAPAASPPEKK